MNTDARETVKQILMTAVFPAEAATKRNKLDLGPFPLDPQLETAGLSEEEHTTSASYVMTASDLPSFDEQVQELARFGLAPHEETYGSEPIRRISAISQAPGLLDPTRSGYLGLLSTTAASNSYRGLFRGVWPITTSHILAADYGQSVPKIIDALGSALGRSDISLEECAITEPAQPSAARSSNQLKLVVSVGNRRRSLSIPASSNRHGQQGFDLTHELRTLAEELRPRDHVWFSLPTTHESRVLIPRSSQHDFEQLLKPALSAAQHHT